MEEGEGLGKREGQRGARDRDARRGEGRTERRRGRGGERASERASAWGRGREGVGGVGGGGGGGGVGFAGAAPCAGRRRCWSKETPDAAALLSE